MLKKRLQGQAFLMLLCCFVSTARAQCLQSIDFNSWRPTGDSSGVITCPAGEWSILSAGAEVYSLCNSNFPKMYVGPDTFINVRITGSFRGEDIDDDFMGFVFGFKETYDYAWSGAGSMNHQYYLFDWKQAAQTWSGYSAQEGFALAKVDGYYLRSLPTVYPNFWEHNSSVGFNVLQTDFGSGKGWVQNVTYDFELLYTPTRALIKINNDTIFDQSGCFEPGRFGFYNYSQQFARYWNFNYQLYVDFDVASLDVCLGDYLNIMLVDTANCSGHDALSNVDTFFWDMGDGTFSSDTNPVHLFAQAGQYEVKLIATDVSGCSDTAAKVVTVHNLPTAAGVAENVCDGQAVNFTETSFSGSTGSLSYSWNFGDGSLMSSAPNPSYSYASSGNYEATLIVEESTGCIDSITMTVVVHENPTANFTASDVCSGDSVHFGDASVSGSAPINYRGWDIDANGVVDYTSLSPAHLYTALGAYSVLYIVSDTNSCSDSIEVQVGVFPNPVVDFGFSDVCFQDTNHFSDSSSVASGSIASWNWNFNNTINSSQPNTSLVFSTAGSKSVKLKVETDQGCMDSVTKPVTVYHLPKAYFDPKPACQNVNTSMSQTSVSQSGSITKFHWKFSDGTEVNSSSVQHSFSTPGLYVVTLTVASQYQCSDSSVKQMRIYPAPDAALSWDKDACEGDPLAFYDQSKIEQVTPGGDAIASWTWSTNDVFHSEQNPVLEENSKDSVLVYLVVTSNHGCRDSVQVNSTVHPLPDANFETDLLCHGLSTTLLDSSFLSMDQISGRNWYFGDSLISTEESIEHIFDRPGDYEVSLVVTSDYGCVDTVSKTLRVYESPKAGLQITPKNGCTPLRVKLASESHYMTGGLDYRWVVDGATVSSDEIDYVVLENNENNPVDHQVAIHVTNADGCTSIAEYAEMITVFPKPNSWFELDREEYDVLHSTVHFLNQTSWANAWGWNFGDGTGSLELAPTHTYQETGQYQVALIATNSFDCKDTLRKQVDIKPINTLYIPSAFSPNGDGNNETWGVVAVTGFDRYEIRIWDRWGQLIATSTDIGFSWDGQLKDSNPAPAGVYTYDILYLTGEGKVEELQGNFSLLR